MRHEFLSDQKAGTTFPLIVLFGVLLAWLMAFLFISVYDQQLNARVDEQAGALANELARSAFTSLSYVQPPFELPRDLGGSVYTIEVQDNNTFVVRIVGGRRTGNTYSAVVNATVVIENRDFSPGGRAYFMRSWGQVIVSASPIEAPIENIVPIPAGEPPEFYYFARENQREATAIGAAYFEALNRYPGENIDVSAFRWEATNSLLAQVTSGGVPKITMRVTGSENAANVGKVVSAWVVELVENAVEIESPTACPSPDNAYRGGWLHSPRGALDHLRSRTWRRVSNNAVVAVPTDAVIQAAAATTNVSTYPTWRVRFENYTIFYQMTPWWQKENTAGFVFQSDPELHPVV